MMSDDQIRYETVISEGDDKVIYIQTWHFQDRDDQRRWLELMSTSVHTLQKKPGFMNMALHSMLDGLSIVVYAQWENMPLWKAAISDNEAQHAHAMMVDLSLEEPEGNLYKIDAVYHPTAGYP